MKPEDFSLTNFDYELAPQMIAQAPLANRDTSRLLIVDRAANEIREGIFKDVLEYLNPGDVLVLNDTKVIKARLYAKKKNDLAVEVLMVKEKAKGIWEVLVKPGRRAHIGDKLQFDCGVSADILGKTLDGGRTLRFSTQDIEGFLEKAGSAPTPPYIKKEVDNPEQYQTVYAMKSGAIAAPTAGFHFTPELLKAVEAKGVAVAHVTLHCGLGTFRPIKSPDIRDHRMMPEWVEISPDAAGKINAARTQGKKIIAVGTTSVRSLESAAGLSGVRPFLAETGLYIMPGYKFKVIDRLITNFHTPRSTNLVLVSCFCSLALRRQAYDYAISKNFRFFSFGDAMIII